MSDLDFTCREAHAKINLTLAVLGRRADGYHEIESWMAPLCWCDHLRFTKADCSSLKITGQVPDVPDDERNLVVKAHAALSAHVGRPLPTRIDLEKCIPTGAGLGGGSSDAAATLLGLNQLWDLRLTIDELGPLAAGIGSDVPFFLTDANAIVTGRGEHVRPISRWQGSVVLIIPPFGTSTAAVYARFAEQPSTQHHGRPWEQPDRPAKELQYELFNDLQTAAFAVEPRLAELHGRIDGLEGQRVLMSGSGSTLYTIFADGPQASLWRNRASALLGHDAKVMGHAIAEHCRRP